MRGREGADYVLEVIASFYLVLHVYDLLLHLFPLGLKRLHLCIRANILELLLLSLSLLLLLGLERLCRANTLEIRMWHICS